MEIITAITAFGALAQETRLSVFRHLVKAGPEGLTAGEIATALSVPAPTMSFHLNHLLQAGLIDRRRASRNLIYTVKYDHMRDLLAFLVEDCCKGQAGIELTETNKNNCIPKDYCCGDV